VARCDHLDQRAGIETASRRRLEHAAESGGKIGLVAEALLVARRDLGQRRAETDLARVVPHQPQATRTLEVEVVESIEA